MQWLGHHDTAPCTNVVLPHKSALKLAPLHAVVEVMLSAGSAPVRVAGRTRLEQAVRYAEVSAASTDIGGAWQALTLLEACLSENVADLNERQTPDGRIPLCGFLSG